MSKEVIDQIMKEFDAGALTPREAVECAFSAKLTTEKEAWLERALGADFLINTAKDHPEILDGDVPVYLKGVKSEGRLIGVLISNTPFTDIEERDLS